LVTFIGLLPGTAVPRRVTVGPVAAFVHDVADRLADVDMFWRRIVWFNTAVVETDSDPTVLLLGVTRLMVLTVFGTSDVDCIVFGTTAVVCILGWGAACVVGRLADTAPLFEFTVLTEFTAEVTVLVGAVTTAPAAAAS